MPRNHSKSIIHRHNVVVDEQRYARFARKRLRADGMPLTVNEPLRMHADIKPPILKNVEKLDADGMLPTLKVEKQGYGEAMPRKDQQLPVS